MAREDFAERSERPTPRRREEARNEGRAARSTDLTASVALLGAVVALNIFAPGMHDRMMAILRVIVEDTSPRADGLPTWIAQCVYAGGEIVLPFMATLLLVTVAVSAAQTGGLISLKQLKPKLENISPAKGVKRLFSLDSVTRTGFGVVKIALIAAIAWFTVVGRLLPVLGAGAAPVEAVLPLAAELILTLALRLALVLLVLGLIDFAYQRFRFEQSIRMTKQEVREELRRMEGDPLIKRRRREVAARLAMQRISTEVPRADVVVTNPTEYAVALRYDEEKMGAPRVVAKGKDFLALRIRQVAMQHRVPVVQRPPLARGLYAACAVGDEIPSEFYKAVAEVLAYVYQISGRAAG